MAATTNLVFTYTFYMLLILSIRVTGPAELVGTQQTSFLFGMDKRLAQVV
jgi:hypothetical protein